MGRVGELKQFTSILISLVISESLFADWTHLQSIGPDHITQGYISATESEECCNGEAR